MSLAKHLLIWVRAPSELPNVVLDVGCDELQDVVGYLMLLTFGFGTEDGKARFEVRGIYLGDETGEKAAAQSVFQGLDRLWWAVRRSGTICFEAPLRSL